MSALPHYSDPTPEEAEPAPEPKRAPVRVKSKAELEREGVKAIYLQIMGRPYVAQTTDHAAWTELKKAARDIAEIEEFWRYSLNLAPTAWAHAPTISALKRKWPDLVSLLAKQRPSQVITDTCAACGGRGECGLWRLTICYRCYAAWLEDDATTRALDAACAAEDYPRAHAVAMTWARERFTRTRSGT